MQEGPNINITKVYRLSVFPSCGPIECVLMAGQDTILNMLTDDRWPYTLHLQHYVSCAI